MSSSLKSKIVQKHIAFLLLLTAAFASNQSVQAASSCAGATDCNIPVTFKGEYIEDTCEISIDGASSTETVTLPTLSANLLNRDSAEEGHYPFQIALKRCPANKLIDLRFVAAGGSMLPDAATGNLQNEVAADYSQNVQVRLRKAAGPQMVVGDGNSVQEYVIPATGDDITHYFLASYYAKGTNAVTSGLVKATAGIELVYK
jgi:type 1 fimbria pilin